MRTINLIPTNYEGNHRDALGYNWANLVMKGCEVDKEESTPGEDMSVSAEECYDMLEAEHGTIAIRDNGSYGWLSKDAKTRAGKTVNIDGLTPIATINGMWCGGVSVSVFAAADAPAKEDPVTETVTIEDDANHQYGHCNKCHTYCYGDCDANQ